jgi:transposase
VQVVIALVVTPEGFPLAYEVLPGNTSDKTTLQGFLAKIKERYGQAEHVWLMDRGIPTEAVLTEMRASDPPVRYVVGTPKSQLNKLEAALTAQAWQSARPQVRVKLLPQDQELYVFVQSAARMDKERAMRRRKLHGLWARLKKLQARRPTYEQLLAKVAVAQHEAGRAAALVKVTLPPPPAKSARSRRVDFAFALDKAKLREVRRREGRYLLRTNLTETNPAKLWEYYMQLVEVEAAFKRLKDDLAIRPIFHRDEDRIDAHIFVAFLAYGVYISFRETLRQKAPGLTVRQLLDKLCAVQMLDVHFPTTDGRELIFTRYTEPEPDQRLVIAQLDWALPAQPPPRLSAKKEIQM